VKKVLLVGGHPPPYGGITVHIQRLKKLLEGEGHKVVVLDLIGKTPVEDENIVSVFNKYKFITLFKSLKYIFFSDEEIIHFHTSAFGNFLYVAPLYLILCLSKRKIITIHSGSFVQEVFNYNLFKKKVFGIVIKKFDEIIVVNNEQKIFLKTNFLNISSGNVHVIPAFLPDVLIDTQVPKELKYEIEQIIQDKSKIILSSGYMQPYYGHHIILNAIKEFGANFHIFICFYSSYNENYRNVLNELKNDNPNVHFHYDLTPREFNYLIKYCDLYIRATDRDGDAVAIREALYLGKSVVASNCVARPSGVITFDRDNINDLIEKIQIGLTIKNNTFVEDTSEILKCVYKN